MADPLPATARLEPPRVPSDTPHGCAQCGRAIDIYGVGCQRVGTCWHLFHARCLRRGMHCRACKVEIHTPRTVAPLDDAKSVFDEGAVVDNRFRFLFHVILSSRLPASFLRHCAIEKGLDEREVLALGMEYKRFLLLMTMASSHTKVVPPPLVGFIWSAHMERYQEYHRQMQTLLAAIYVAWPAESDPPDPCYHPSFHVPPGLALSELHERYENACGLYGQLWGPPTAEFWPTSEEFDTFFLTATPEAAYGDDDALDEADLSVSVDEDGFPRYEEGDFIESGGEGETERARQRRLRASHDAKVKAWHVKQAELEKRRRELEEDKCCLYVKAALCATLCCCCFAGS